jgi:hypothetical protein
MVGGVRDQIVALEQRLSELAVAIMLVEDHNELNGLEAEIRVANLAIERYRAAAE